MTDELRRKMDAGLDSGSETGLELDVAEETVTYVETTVEAHVDQAQWKALVEGVWGTRHRR